jgi:hypothetical protein
MGTMSFVVSPDASFMVTPGGTQDIPAFQKELILKEMHTQPLYVAQHQEAPGLSLRAGPREKVGEVEAQVLEVAIEGAQAKWWVDPATGRILRSAASMPSPRGPSEQISEYSDFRTVEGLSLPFKRAQTRDGQPTNSSEVQEVQVNLNVEPQTFARPPKPPQ